METMLTGIVFKTLNFIILIPIPMIKIMILPLTYMLDIPSITMNTELSNYDSLICQNMSFNQRNMTKIQCVPYLVGYLLKPLNGKFWPPPIMILCPWVPISRIIINHLFLQWICIYTTNLMQLILYIPKCQTSIMVLPVPNYLLAQSD